MGLCLASEDVADETGDDEELDDADDEGCDGYCEDGGEVHSFGDLDMEYRGSGKGVLLVGKGERAIVLSGRVDGPSDVYN